MQSTMSTASQILYITENDVIRHLDWGKLFIALEEAFGDFSQKDDGGIIQPVRSSIIIPENSGFFGVMPSYCRKLDVIASKLVTAFPNNKPGFPTHNALVCIFSPENGIPLAIVEGEYLTGVRTALASAVATKHLVKKVPKKLTILGTGVQAQTHLDALKRYYDFQEICVWGRTYENAKSFAKKNECTPYENVEDAVSNADVICTVTFARLPILKASWVKEGAHINAVGAVNPQWAELEKELMEKALVFADSKEACLKESGDVILSQAEIFAEIGEVINGSKTFDSNRITVFKSVGIAVEDAVAAKLVFDSFVEHQN